MSVHVVSERLVHVGTNNVMLHCKFFMYLLAKLGFRLEVNWAWLTVLYLVLLFQFLTDPGVILAQNHCKLLEGPRSSSGQDLQQSDHFVLSGRLLLQNKSQKRTELLLNEGKKVHSLYDGCLDLWYWTKMVIS